MARKKKSWTLDQPVVEASEYETPMPEDDLQEEYPEPEPEIVFTPPPVVVPEKNIRIAIPIAIAEGLATAKAKKTCKKFVGKWVNLKQGKSYTDTKEVIAHLRAHDLLE